MTTYKQPWINTAFAYKGTNELSGSANSQKILNWAKIVGGNVATDYNADSIPWCGLFVSFCMAQNGIVPVDQPLWALNWNKFGTKLTEPAFGCVMVFKRPSGGHVAFYIGEDSSNYIVLGGNQSDTVSLTKIAKSRCVGYRWPPNMDKFLTKGRVKTTLAGAVSTNEA